MWRTLLLFGVACGRIGYDERPPDDGLTGVDGTDGPVDVPGASACGMTVHLSDTFDDGVAAPNFLPNAMPGMTVSETGGDLVVQFAPTVAAGNYAYYRSAVAYPMDGFCVTVETVEAPANGGALYLKLRTAQLEVEMFGHSGVLETRTRQSNTVVTRDMFVLDLSVQRYWRLHQVGTSTFWETSPDGVTYLQHTRLDGFFTANMAQLELGAGAVTAVTNGGTARFASASAVGP
ncbi:MAG: hypothetical protein H0T89_10665 [Deltaproteobacteria bacterium]|nr:hypothetical protein [Deltaproteobacteria bacterium]MDQ3298943.1 hypothetical protein [Myxococcota bacterium]